MKNNINEKRNWLKNSYFQIIRKGMVGNLPVIDQNVKYFLKKKLKGMTNFTIPMDNLLGVGGQGVVIRKTITINNKSMKCAVRFVPVDNRHVPYHITPRLIRDRLEILNTAMLYEEELPCEMIAAQLSHENIIVYFDHTFEVIDGTLYHLTGFYY